MLKSIIQKDPNYILWCIINLIHFSIDDSILLNPNFKNQSLFPAAMEYNHLKNCVIVMCSFEEETEYFERIKSFNFKAHNDEDGFDDYEQYYDFQIIR